MNTLTGKIFLTLIYLLSLFMGITVFAFISGKIIQIENFDFHYFDAVHYESIKNGNYIGWLSAFFPGFPLLWKTLNVGIVSISAINLCLFVVGYSLLSWNFNFNRLNHFLYLTIPSIFFFALPYSESLFFLSSVLVLIGLKRKMLVLLIAGTLLCSITRPVAFLFIPTYFAILSYHYIKHKKFDLFSFSGIISSVVGLLLAFIIQYLFSDIWFEFFSAQKQGWGNALQFPNVPLKSWGGNFITGLDGVALWIALSLCPFLFKYFSSAFKKTNTLSETTDYATLFSVCFLVGTGLLILFTRGGMIFSLNRFVFLTPFFTIAILFATKESLQKKTYIIIFSSLIVFFLLLGSYGHIKSFITYLLVSVLVTLIIWLKQENKPGPVLNRVVLFVILCSLQIIIAMRILSYNWVA